MNPGEPRGVNLDAKGQLTRLQSFLTLPRETIPHLTTREARRILRDFGSRVGLEFLEIEGVAPIFLLVPEEGILLRTVLFQTWHAEAASMEPGAVDGAERLALSAALAAVEAVRSAEGNGASIGPPPVALVVAPAATSGSRMLDQVLRDHRARLTSGAAYWIRIAPKAPRRRRMFLGARGKLVVAIRGGDGNPYRARDQVIEALSTEAYGPRPLDFELIRKVASEPDCVELLREAREGAAGIEERIRAALFLPRGDVVIPPVAHQERPRAWISLEIAEAMEPEPILASLAEATGGEADLVEHFPWDRASIHHPATQALIALAKSRSQGPEIWPAAPWPTPSGVFTRALGVGLMEWAIPLPTGAAFRIPKVTEFEAIALEAAELLRPSSTS